MIKLITNSIARNRTNYFKNSKKHKRRIQNKFRQSNTNPLFMIISITSHITQSKKVFIMLKLQYLYFHSKTITTFSPLIHKTSILKNAKRKIFLKDNR